MVVHGLRQAWNRLAPDRRLMVIIAVAVAVAVIVSVLVAVRPWESRREKQCKAIAAQELMLRGEDYDAFVRICVEYQ